MTQEIKNLWSASNLKGKVFILIPAGGFYVCMAIVAASFIMKCVF